jgi:oxygen-independent coproporphyrinogen-3 oxidase
MRAFIDAILLEGKKHVEKIGENKLTTLYCGGGTPSMLSPTHLKFLFSGLREIFDMRELKELTFEANPATFDLTKAKLFKELGITRISLGIQSFDNGVLKTLGREHNREEAMAAVPILREAGIQEVNIDLMFSIPRQTLEVWQDTLDTAVSLKPDHISAYNLTYEEDTAFIDKLTAGEYQDDPETNAQMFTAGHETLTAAGFEHYETSNYAKIGTRSTHNLSYWKGSNYLGLGPSAVSTVGNTRWKNLPDTANYINQINHVGHAQTEIEHLTSEDLHLEQIALQLRTTDGLPLDVLSDGERQRAQSVIDEGMAKVLDGNMILTGEGRLLVDSIVEHIV